MVPASSSLAWLRTFTPNLPPHPPVFETGFHEIASNSVGAGGLILPTALNQSAKHSPTNSDELIDVRLKARIALTEFHDGLYNSPTF